MKQIKHNCKGFAWSLCAKKLLFAVLLLSGLLLCDPRQEYIDALTVYGNNIGLTFQIVDDELRCRRVNRSTRFTI